MTDESEGTIVQAARWLVSETFHTLADRAEGRSTAFPTIAEAVGRFGLGRGEDSAMLRVAEEMKAQTLAQMPPLVGERDPAREAALSSGPYRKMIYS